MRPTEKEQKQLAYIKRVRTINKQIIKDILIIGIPAFLENLFMTFTNIIDSKMVSAMGVTAISAVSVTNAPRLFILSIFIALCTVLTSLVAKSYGENNRDEANRIFDSVLKMTLVLSIIASVLSVTLARPIMIAFSHQPDTLEDSILYFRIVMGCIIFNTLFITINAAMRGFGKTNLTFISNVVSSVVNITFNYFLIEGHFGFPALGIKGAAIATVLGTVAAFIMMAVIACRKELFVNIPYCLEKKYKYSSEGSKTITSLAKSTITDGLASRVSILIISGIVARIGSYQMAIYSVGMHLLNINTALGMGLQTAGVALIGRCFGAKDKDKMNLYKRNIVFLGAACAIVLGIMIIIGGRWFYGFFTDDPEFIRLGGISCIFIGCITLSQTIKFSYVGCLQGVGAMKEVMTAGIVSFAFVNLSVLAICVFVLKLGLWGPWIGTLIAQSIQALMVYTYTKRNPAF